MAAVELTAEKNTWTHQRRKRRQKCSEISEPETKKVKIDENVREERSSLDFHLTGSLRVRMTDQSVISLQLDWIKGGLGRESMNQILQYLKNRLFDK